MGKIIWLASYPKSGNTWLRAFIHNLLRNPKEGFDINKLTAFTLGDSMPAFYRKHDPRAPEQLSFEDVARLRPQVHKDLTLVSPDNVFVKTHNALVQDHGHPTINFEATAGAIYVVRNPLDVAISYAHHQGVGVDDIVGLMAASAMRTPNRASFVSELVCSWSIHVESWTARPNPGLHVVRYEDMHAKPQQAFGGIAGFLGLKPPRERLERAIQLSSFRSLRDQEDKKGFAERSPMAERFFREGKSGQWKGVLAPAQVARIVQDHRAQMTRFGYVPEGV